MARRARFQIRLYFCFLLFLLACFFTACLSLSIGDSIDAEPSSTHSLKSQSRRWIDAYFDESSKMIGKNVDSLNKTDNDATGNRVFCDTIVEWMWKEVIPTRYNEAFNKALLAQRRRHIAVAKGTPEKGQKYIVWSLSGGLGNRIQAIASVFMAAMLSERVLLMKDWFTPLRSSRNSPIKPTLLPFVKSDRDNEDFRYENLQELFWFSNKEHFPRISNDHVLCNLFPMMSLSEFERIYPSEFRSLNDSTISEVLLYKEGHAKIDIRAGHDKKLKLWNRFACGDEATKYGVDFFSKQRFVYVWTNQYFLPLFYMNKRTSSTMASWIPVNPFRSLLPLIFLPSKPVMHRVLLSLKNGTYVKKRDFVGLHIRSFKRHEVSQLIESFSHCIEHFLSASTAHENFFLATMYHAAKKHFSVQKFGSGAYFFKSVEDQMNEEQSTGQGALQEWNAVADVVLLSLSKQLFLSPDSTFGFVAAAAGEIDNITVVNPKNHSFVGMSEKTCLNRDQSVVMEPCFTSWFKLDSIGKRIGHIKCKLDRMPQWATLCGTNS